MDWFRSSVVLVTACSLPVRAADETKADYFENKVRPLLLEKCVDCHGADETSGGLRLDRAADAFDGGDSGPVLRPGDPDSSRLIRIIRGDDSELSMPPDKQLPREDIAILEAWVKQGAVWPGYDPSKRVKSRGTGPLFSDEQKSYWAFQPLDDAEPPLVDNAWIRTPIDAFILTALQQRGLAPSPPADRLTLLRRVTFDLTGLPPTPDQIQSFLEDTSPIAWHRVVERLLASPAYGEKWGRHWLDIARFAESAAHDGNNGYLHAWRYRDYVIEFMNRDRPYDEFIFEQLAGDLIPDSTPGSTRFERMVATGFLQVGPKPVVMRDKSQMLLDIADEQLTATGVAFLGLTIGCARCHDHKFDPIPTQDYYSLAGIFTSTHVMFDHAADSMWIEPEIAGPDGKTVRAMAVQDHAKPRDLQVHLRGSYHTLGETAPRRFLQIIAGENHEPISTKGSGRLELAQWIADPANPLTSRVMVNRIWQHHFGRGIVASSDDFGVRGDPPTHPQLLDWLANEFLRSDWSVKAMHRLMLHSATYAQSSRVANAVAATADPENRLLWKMPRRRLAAEEIRDSLLLAGQALDRRMGGTLFTSGYNFNRPDVKLSVVDIGDADTYEPYRARRRCVYLPVIRNQMHPMLALFDVANEHIPVATRSESTVAPQALFLMNSQFARECARQLGVATHALKDGERIETLYATLLGRPPSEGERAESLAYVAAYRESLGIDPDAETPERPTFRSYAESIRSTEGLLAYYRLNEVKTIDGRLITPNELSENGGELINGAAFVADGAVPYQHGKEQRDPSIAFNGTNQRVQFDNVDYLSKADTAISIEYWINPAQVGQEYGIGLDHLPNGQRYWKSGIHPVDVNGSRKNVIYHEFFGAGGGFRFRPVPEAVAEVGKWTHVVFNMGHGKRQLFVNGTLTEEFATAAKPTFGGSPLTLGARADGEEWFRGGIDEVAIYSGILDAGTVKDHYLLGRNRDLVAANADLEVWQSLSQALFCMNEFIFVD